jgi:acyl-homoserine lactone acylase PvdQ
MPASAYTADDFSRMQNDVKEQDADLMLPRLLAAAPATDAGRQALALLKSWDRMMERGPAGAADLQRLGRGAEAHIAGEAGRPRRAGRRARSAMASARP